MESFEFNNYTLTVVKNIYTQALNYFQLYNSTS